MISRAPLGQPGHVTMTIFDASEERVMRASITLPQHQSSDARRCLVGAAGRAISFLRLLGRRERARQSAWPLFLDARRHSSAHYFA